MELLVRKEKHVCFLCGKTFSRLANLKIHQRSPPWLKLRSHWLQR